MSQPIPVQLSDDEDDIINNAFITPVSHHHKRPRSDFPPNPTNLLIIDDSPTPHKLQKSASSTPSFVPETPFSDLPKPKDPPIIRCTAHLPDHSSGPSTSLSCPSLPGVGGLICLESDDEAEEDPGRGTSWKNLGTLDGLDVEKELERSPKFSVEKWLDIDSTFCLHKVVQSNVHVEAEGLGKRNSTKDRGSLADFDVEENLETRPNFVVNDNCQENGRINADSEVECLEKSPTVVQSTCYLGKLKSTKTYDYTYLEDDTNQILPVHDHDHYKENVRLEVGGEGSNPKSGGEANAGKKRKKGERAANRKKSKEEKMHLMEEKKLKKEQEKLHKAALKAEAAKLRQLEKEKQKLEKFKFGDKNILAEIDPQVVQLGSIGGHLLTRFGEKGISFKITPNPIEKSIVWRMTLPEGMSQLSSVATVIPYILLIYNAEEFCKLAIDGSLVDHISSVRNHYPSYTICCLTNRLMSYINKREQHKFKNGKDTSDWKRPPVEEVFAKLTTQFAHIHSRQCADEAEVAEHVVGLTINLAKCHSRKKLTHLSVNANGCNVPKDCADRGLIMKHPWLKALVSIPKVQPRFAIAIWKKYPTLKSLLSVYMDPTKSVHHKEFLLKDLMMEGLLGNEDRRLGEICSKRVYRILMAQNGSIKTDDVENGADFFKTNNNS